MGFMEERRSVTYRVRRVDADDYADELRAMHDVAFADDTPKPTLEGATWWIAFYEDVPAGFAALKPSIGEPGAGYLYRCGVLKEHRGNSLQRRLIQARVNWARLQGMTALRTDTTDNPRSSNNLIHAGFRVFTPSAPWAFANSIYWRKELRA
jgi:GNAT superfamily N-acetyltransferase